jgi:hypothetical protein
MLHVSAIQGHLQTRGVLLHCTLPEYLLFIMSLLFSSYILFVVRLFMYFVTLLFFVVVCLCVHCLHYIMNLYCT